MTQYTQDDFESNWEFKIVRSDAGAFRKPEIVRKLVEEEARAGWVMLEKFDDSRIRFKRPRSARARDAFLPDDVDPYRTQYGAYAARRAVLVGVMLGLVLLLGAGVAAMFAHNGAGPATEGAVVPVVLLLILIIMGFMVVAWKMRRLR
jgi:hypothetical protein